VPGQDHLVEVGPAALPWCQLGTPEVRD